MAAKVGTWHPLTASAGPGINFSLRGFQGKALACCGCTLDAGFCCLLPIQFGTVLTLNPLGAIYYFIEPVWSFKLLGIQYHVPALSFGMYAILMGATVSMILGKNTRTSIIVIILCIFYLKGVRDSFAGDVHHREIIPMQMLFLFLLSKCGKVHSRDARQLRLTEGVQEWEASWPIKTMQLYVALFYFWSVIAKVRTSGWVWFAGEGKIQEVLIQRSVRWGVTDQGEFLKNGLSFELAQHPELIQFFAILVLAFKLVCPLLLLIKSVKLRLVSIYGSHHIPHFLLRLNGRQLFANSICLSYFL